MSTAVLARWSYHTKNGADVVVLPDGCRDIVRREDPGRGVRWFVTDIDDSARKLVLPSETTLVGWRLKPGAEVCAQEVGRLSLHSSENEKGVLRCCELSPQREELLLALRAAASLDHACRLAGLSRRTMQRTALKVTGRSPRFWMQLARIRRAARALGADENIGRTAYCTGFSDQAHLTREMRRWFSVTPRGLLRNPALLRVAASPGFE